MPIHHKFLCQDFTVSLGIKTLSEHFNDANMKLFNRGRSDFHLTVSKELIQAVKQESDLIHCGINKVCERLNKEGFECSRYPAKQPLHQVDTFSPYL